MRNLEGRREIAVSSLKLSLLGAVTDSYTDASKSLLVLALFPLYLALLPTFLPC